MYLLDQPFLDHHRAYRRVGVTTMPTHTHTHKFHPAKLGHVRTVLKQFPEIVNT